MNKLLKDLRNAKIWKDGNNFNIQIPRKTSIISKALGKIKNGPAELSFKSKKDYQDFLQIITGINMFLERYGFNSCLWIYKDLAFGKIVLYKRDCCVLKIKNDSIVISARSSKCSSWGLNENVKLHLEAEKERRLLKTIKK